MPDGKSQALSTEKENVDVGRSTVEGHLREQSRSHDSLLADSSKFTHPP